MKKYFYSMACLLGGLFAFLVLPAQSGFHLMHTYHIASPGGWDYIAAGPGNGRIYVSHGTQVNILNAATGDSVGVIPNTTGVHGIAFDPAMNTGYTSNGRLNSVTVFDLRDNHVITTIPTGENPDAIMYDPFTKRIITCNGRSQDLSVIDPATAKVVATIPVGGKPETAVSDEKGRLFVNLEDKSSIAVVNLAAGKVETTWSLSPSEGPTGLAIDRKTMRLFAGCDKTLVVIDATQGTVTDRVTIGDGCDGVGFDEQTHLVFASCGEGVLSVVREDAHGKCTLVENAPSKRGARTLAVDPATHQVYLPTADFEQTTQPGERRPRMIPGTFQVLVMGR
ncbi:MAG TPA: YncE family protein [Chitinophagaceae bacterium]|nr:YncE family protein [Chitinophagaceae bacterium]